VQPDRMQKGNSSSPFLFVCILLMFIYLYHDRVCLFVSRSCLYVGITFVFVCIALMFVYLFVSHSSLNIF